MKFVTLSLRPLYRFRRNGTGGGFTLVELVVVVAILGILLTLLLPAFGPIRDRVERVVCMGNLRSLYTSLSSYVTDNQQWPQCPVKASRAVSEKFWTTTLADYGAKPETWICPTLKRKLALAVAQGEDVPKVHYVPAQFDDKAATPFKWPAMPWVIEIGDMHLCGSLLIRGDGGIKTMNDIFAEAGVSPGLGGGSAVHKLK